MIKGKQVQPKVFVDKPQVNYRKLDALNQSMLKLFDNDPVKFFEEFKLGKTRKDKKNASLMIGDLVDFFILECDADDQIFQNRFDEKFVLYEGAKGSGQVFVLADAIFDEAENCLNEKGEVSCSFSTLFSNAFKKVQDEGKYKGKTEDHALKDFEENGRTYYDARMENIGKTVVPSSIIDKAKKVAEGLITDEFTRHLFKGHSSDEYITHFCIEWRYEIDPKRSIACKSEIDMMLIDHDHKIIQPIDLKTTYDNESFDIGYIKNSYYLQAAFYNKAVEEWAKQEGMDAYEIRPMKFVVGDTSSNNRRPLIYTISKTDLEKGMNGFDFRGMHYRGVAELIDDIAWAEEFDVWNCSREAYQKKGRLKLNIKYE